MRDRSYEELTALRHFQRRASNPLERHREEGRVAVEVAHAGELKQIADCLSGGQSVLVECDKVLSEYLLLCLTEDEGEGWGRAESLPAMNWAQVTYNGSSLSPPDSVVAQLIRTMAESLRNAFNSAQGSVVVLRHLDLMMWTAENRPRQELNDIIFWLSEFPSVVKLAFWDPTFPMPKVVSSLFPNRLSLQAFDRSVLWQLVTAAEAKRLSPDTEFFKVPDQSKLYQYVSGTNVVELRRILRGLDQRRPDGRLFVEHPSNTADVYEYIRSQTGLAPIVKSGEVAGYEELRERLRSEIKFPIDLRRDAKDEAELRRADALVPRGVILYGPPGLGKTEWAKWLAVELSIPLFVIHGPELKSKYVGETEAALRQVFAHARRAAPSMILIDEIDAMTPTRAGNESNFEASMVAQFLSEMDGVRREESVIIVGTTNRFDAVDPAFLRPGRFSSQIEVGYPTAADRRFILEYYRREYLPELDEESIGMLVAQTEGALDEKYEQELRAYFKDYLRSQAQVNVGPHLEKQLARRFGLDSAPACFSGDHLRAICLYLLRASLARESPADINDPALLLKAVEAVRRRRAQADAPPVPAPLGWGKRHPA